MNRNTSDIRRYLDQYYNLLHCRQHSGFDKRIVRTVQRALSERDDKTLPVKLKPVASDFLIEPVPRLDSKINSFGRIEFNNNIGKFVISIGTGRFQQSRKRLRFTYAHEFAHRFFFIPARDTWIRASEEIARNIKNLPLKLKVMSSLNTIEEAKCNRIAGELLVPQEILHEIAFSKFPVDIWVDLFPSVLLGLSDCFYVTRECVLNRLSNMEFPETLKAWTAFLVAFSSEKYRGGLGDKKLRIYSVTGSWKRECGKQIYPGISVEHFGKDFSSFIHDTWRQQLIEPSLILQKQVVLTNQAESHKLIGQLSATLFKRLPEQMILVWGNIR